MKAVKRATPPRESVPRVGVVCAHPSESRICEACSEKIRLEALARKKREEQGAAWSHWD